MKITIQLPAIAGALLLLAACNSSSPDDIDETANGGSEPAVSANIEATQALLEQARRDWQAAGLQNYLYHHLFAEWYCDDDDGDTADWPMATTHVVPDTEAPMEILPQATMQGDKLTYTVPGAAYESIYDQIQAIIDSEPELLVGDVDDPESLPLFTERGELLVLGYKKGSCAYRLHTTPAQELDELNYSMTEQLRALNTGRNTWLGAGIDDYQVQVRFIGGSCEAPELSEIGTVVVTDGEVTERDTMPGWMLWTIEYMVFDAMAENLRMGRQLLQAGIDDVSAVAYEPNFGFPQSTYAERFDQATDGEETCAAYGVIVEDFR